MHNLKRTMIALLIAVSAGCGGSAGGGGDSGASVPPSGGPISLGSRGVPGGTVAVSCDGAITPGVDTTFHLAIGTGLVPTLVTARIGTDTQDGAVGIEAVPTGTGIGNYDVHLAVPKPIPAGSHVWVRLVFADNSVIETGANDFPLIRP